MAIAIRTAKEIDGVRTAGLLATEIIRQLSHHCRPGVTTASLARTAESIMRSHEAEPVMCRQTNAAGERFPFAASICINEEVGVGLPGPRRIRPGDVVSIDVALRLDGWCADAATTIVMPGERSPRLAEVSRTVRDILGRAIERLRPGARWLEVAASLAWDARQSGLTLVPDFGAHGVGRELHEPPELAPATDLVLRPGMVLAIEPVFVTGAANLVDLLDGWGAATKDRGIAFHEERTIAVTRAGPVVLAGSM